MSVESNWWFYPVPPDSVPIPTGGARAFFMSDGSPSSVSGPTVLYGLYRKDGAGACVALIPVAYTDEAAQDAVGTILGATASVVFTYDDTGNAITANVPAEYVQDVVGALLTASNGTIVVTYNDAGNIETIGVGSITTANFPTFTEDVQDAVGAALVSTATVTLTYNDAGNQITADVVTEGIQDLIGAFISAGDGSIVVTYNDAGNAETIAVGTITSAKVSDFTEAAQDAIGAMLGTSATIAATYNDAGNAETFGVVNNSIGLTQLGLMTGSTVIGQVAGSGSAQPVYLSDDQLMLVLNEGVGASRFLVANVSLAASTAEQVVATFAMPAGSITAPGVYTIHIDGASTQSAAAVTATAKVHVGATGSGTGGLIAATSSIASAVLARTTQPWTVDAWLTVRSVGAGGTVIGQVIIGGPYYAGATAGTVVPITTPVAIDTTQARDIVLTITFSATTQTATTITGGFIRRDA